MRPHVELVDERDLLWHRAEFEYANGEARQQHLSYDEEDGSASLKVEFTSSWSRAAGIHEARTEWFVLAGEVIIGDQVLHKGGYWCAPKGVVTPSIEVVGNTQILLFREHGAWGFEPLVDSAQATDRDSELVIKPAESMGWFPIEDPHDGSPIDIECGAIAVPSLFIKLLYRDPRSGFYTRLIKAKAGWREHSLAHHTVFEEAYCLDGECNYNYGVMKPGQYSFRPAGIRHGGFTAGEEAGCTWILRCDGDLVDGYIEQTKVEMKGLPVNWSDDFSGTEPPAYIQPVRSRTVGKWLDPSYQ
jgi:hypothetical protein